ncbi:CD209 antigen-like protein C [Pangasianodon hypophthalmus]|uniref:CD209 antigen-like protein C n=1 Tax=Pangasianodon hypophthalmus TaxID=310915 RepID=UPI00147FF15D|nr:CD209 antigen-like protein C [Pangasianodon hypophthalmus]
MDTSLDIYEDSLECQYVNWKKSSNPRKISNQGPQRSGDDNARSRRSRCVSAVCVALLCVLLLSVIIVLTVKLNSVTRERDQLQISYDNMTAERDQLHTERDGLQMMLNNSIQQCQRYFMTTEKKSWNDARQDCRSKGADLAIITSREDQEFLSKIFKGTEAWIGLIDIAEEGMWKWVDGTTLTNGFWWDEEPNDYNNDEDCAVTGSKFAKAEIRTWADYPCNIPVLAICQMSSNN